MQSEIIESIKAKIAEIESDDRYPKDPSQDANVFSNAPLALIQMGMKGQVQAYNYCIRLIQEQ